MKTLFALTAAAIFAAMPLHAAVVGKGVQYQEGGVTLKGYLAYDDALKGKRPGVLVVHEWWGHNAYAQSRARQLAEMGYAALAVDMYGDGKTADHPDTAAKFMAEATKSLPAATARFRAGRSFLAAQPQTDAGSLGAIGYCFGGRVVLQMARQGEDLAAVASFHGDLGTVVPAQSGKVKARVLVMTGAEDPMVPGAAVEAFRKEMDAAGAKYRVISYPGAKHSFTNPEATALGEKFKMPLAYDAAADRASWAELSKFLAETFRKK